MKVSIEIPKISSEYTCVAPYPLLMKACKAQKPSFQKFFLALLFPIVFVFCFSPATSAQGWGFTFNLTQSGPCGATIPALPTFTVPTVIPTQGQCEGLRQSILAIKISAPQYDNKGNYIGDCSVFYTCTPCTGSDIVISGQTSPGDVSFDAQYTGEPFFTTHESSAFEDWAKEYKQQLESFGITSFLGNSINPSQIPMTGDARFDAFYTVQTASFNPTTAPVSAPQNMDANVVDLSGKTGVVGLLTTPEEQAKRDKWYEDKGFNDLAPITAVAGIEESKPAEKDFKESSLRFALEQLPVVGTVAGGMLNMVDAVLGEDGLPKAVQQATRMDYQGAIATSNQMQKGVRDATANTMMETIKNSFVDPVKGAMNSGIIAAFKVGEKGEKAVEIVTGGAELYQSWKEKN